MVSTKFFLTIPKCSTCTAISPAAEEVILKKTLPYYARPHLKNYALKKRSHAFWSLLFSYALDVLLVFMMRFRYPFGLFPRPPPPHPSSSFDWPSKLWFRFFFRHSIEKVLSDVHICKKWRKGERLHRQPIKLIFKHERWHPRHEKPPFLVHFRL